MSRSPKKNDHSGQPAFSDPNEILMNAPVGIFSSTPEGKLLSANQAMAKMFGYDSPQKMIESVTDIGRQLYVDPKDWKVFVYLLEEYGEVINHECRLLRRDGTEFWASRNGHAVRGEGEHILAYHGFIMNISERKRPEDQALGDFCIPSSLLETIPIAMFHKDKKGRYQRFNREFEHFFGKSREELIGKSVFDINPFDLAKIYHAKDKELFNNPGSQIYEAKVKNARGEVRDVIFHKASLTDEQGEVTGLIGAVLDVTDRKRVEAALKERVKELNCLYKISRLIEKKDNLGKLFQSVADVMPNGWQYPEISCVRIVFQGRKYQTNTFRKTDWRQSVNLYAQGNRVGTIDLCYLEERPAMDEGPFLKDERNLINTIAKRLGDVITRKNNEDQIKLINQQLERANAEKDKLFSIIAHDLKSPMAGIFNTSQIIDQEAESLSRDDLRTMSTEMYKSTGNALTLLNDLMQWARMSQGGMDFNVEECGLHELARSSIYSARDMAEKKNVSIRCDIPQGLTILADQPMINTVIRNIIFNSVKFTNPGGNISVTARKKDSDVEVCVQDDGIGMNEVIISKIFSVDKSKRQYGTDGEKGTGLGLILCKEFVEKHGGRIWVESEPGEVTKVFFTLPTAT